MADLEDISLHFDWNWNNLDELESALDALAVVDLPNATIEDRHCDILYNVSKGLGASDVARANAVELSRGYNDLVVILLEPTQSEASNFYEDKLPRTIQRVDQELQSASCGARKWENTCILDARPFRSKEVRAQDEEQNNHDWQASQDGRAYGLTKAVLDKLVPDVIILCQNETKRSPDAFARSLSSSVKDFGEVTVRTLEDGKQLMAINGFHPMHVMRLNPTVSNRRTIRLRNAALRFVFLQATNVLKGNIIRGPGVGKLRDDLYGRTRESSPLSESGLLDRMNEGNRHSFTKESPEYMREVVWLVEEVIREKEELYNAVTARRFRPGATHGVHAVLSPA